MPVSLPGGLAFVSLLYFGYRVERFDEIWDETELFESKIERELVTYMHEYFAPFREEAKSKFESSMNAFEPDLSVESDESNPVTKDGGTPNIDLQDSDEIRDHVGNVEWEDIFAGGPAPPEFVAQFMSNMAELTGAQNTSDLQTGKPAGVRYMMNEDLVDASEIFSDILEKYDSYRNYRFLLVSSKVLVWLMLIGSVIITGKEFIGISLPTYVQNSVIIVSVLWIMSECILWMFLDRAVPAEGHTPVRKIGNPFIDFLESNLPD